MPTPAPSRPILTIEAAKSAAAASFASAAERELNVAVAIVDEGGRLLYFERMDGTGWGSGEVALGKAVSAAAYRRDTMVFDKRLASGRFAVLGQPQAFPIEGGLPLLIDGRCVGAIGISGALASEDTTLAEAAVTALAALDRDGDA